MENASNSAKPPVKGKPSEQEKLDDALDDSFPASDPPSQTDPDKGPKRQEQ